MKKKFTLLLLLALLGAMPMMADDDTRTVISDAVFTGTIPTLEAGDSWTWAKRNAVGTALTPANSCYYIYDAYASTFALQKKNEDNTYTTLSYDGTGTTITAGTYRFRSQLRITSDSDPSNAYRLSNSSAGEAAITLTVAGQTWTVSNPASFYSTYSYVWVSSPDFEIAKKVLPFQFDFNSSLNYGMQYINQPIETKDLKPYTIGGTETYTYTKKTNHVTWLNVSSDGIISGTPTATSLTAYYDTIQISDGNETLEIRILAGKVAPAKEDREEITSASFTGWVNPAIGDVISSSYYYSFQSHISAAEGAHYSLPDATIGRFYKKQDDNTWQVLADGDAFEAGEYKWSIQIRCDGDDGYFYYLTSADNMTVTVDGTDCPVSSGGSGDNYSYLYFSYSFRLGNYYKVTLTAENGIITVTEPVDLNNVAENTVLHLSAAPDDVHYHFVQWSDGITTATREITVTDNITLSAEFAINTYTITIVAENGSVTAKDADNNDVDLSEKVAYGTVLTLTATAAEGYTFKEWQGYDSETGLTVTEDVTITAVFEKNKATGIHDIQGDDVQCTKILHDGQVLIFHGNKTYNILGVEVK